MKSHPIQIIVVAIIFVCSSLAWAETTGSIRGIIRDRQTQEPVIGASVQIENSSSGSISDMNGQFLISNLLTGTKSVRISAIGYLSAVRTDIQVSPNKSSFLSIALEPQSIESHEMINRAV